MMPGGFAMSFIRGLAAATALTLVSGAVGLHASDAMKTIVGFYLEIHAQLATDKLDGIKTSATALATAASALGATGEPMAKAARSLADAADVKAAREAFGPLSDAVVAAAKAEGWKDLGDVKLAYCPMVKRSWLQKDEKIRNPYYGSTMLECGEFKKP
jgi:hypothetical protein